jgi:hypothetical protein
MTSKTLFKSVRGLLFCVPFLFAFAVTGCGDDEEEVADDDCSEVCNSWADCGHSDFDVDACVNNCVDIVEDDDVDTCNDCLVDLSCTTVSEECDDECAWLLD